jgi:acyl dehydratase
MTVPDDDSPATRTPGPAVTTTRLADLRELLGTTLGPSGWVGVDQARIDLFADATGDHQWIHTDPVRAAGGPFGTTIAHGFLTLSLLIPMWTEILDVTGARTKVNYGLNRVRFPAPVPTGSRVRMTATVADVEPVPGGYQLTVDMVIECDAAAKAVCAAQAIFRFYE